MSLSAGTRFGPYDIVAPLGAGAMGEVYRAHDVKLGRDVALKILPESLSLAPDRLSRFHREAKVLASLNHPHIGGIYGFEQSSGIEALVLELVEGPTLADRIARGAIPLDEALPIARQIAEALEAAHEQGIIHRDLKPANIKITPAGVVKVLDFGLAKAAGADVNTSPEVSHSSTTTIGGTQEGMILGTAAYMSPEQAKGLTVDKRSDVWAFGCVLYEILAGRAVFAGKTVSDVISEVLKSEPDWGQLPPETPASIRRLLRRCLQKDRLRRLRDIADARIEVDEALTGPHADGRDDVQTTSRGKERVVWVSALAVVTLVAAGQAVWLRRPSRPMPPAPQIKFEIAMPSAPLDALAGRRLENVAESLAISPDGLKIVFSALSEGRPQLWLRPLDSVSARPLAGTDLALWPFWSPDSRSVGFFADSQLKRIDIDGGSIQALAKAPFGYGGAWNHDDTILFAPIFSGPIFRIRATGGEASALTRLEKQQTSHFFPRFLPDGRRFFYSAIGASQASGVYLSEIDGSGTRRLLDADMAVVDKFTDQLLFVRQGMLFAQPFDLVRLALAGTPSPVAEQVASVSVSDVGPIAYRTSSLMERRQFAWFDRAGKEIGRVGSPDSSIGLSGGDPSLSRDGRYVALHRTVGTNDDIWLLELARGVLSRFTTEDASEIAPRWSPDGGQVVFGSNRNGVYDLYSKSTTAGGSEELVLATSQNKSVTDWSADGGFLLYRSVDPTTSHDLWALPLDGDKKPFPVVRTDAVEPYGQFSPDGKWIAYQSNESGRDEVYVQPFPGPGAKVRISTNGGAQMRWRRDGKELFYIALDGRLMTVPIQPGHNSGALEPATAAPLFTTNVGPPVPPQSGYNQSYMISPDGQRFLMSIFTEQASVPPITVVLNWQPKR
jgi:eukaryotic-like serine/threonine-protein kinase